MKIYKVKVNGKEYKVELEAVEEAKSTFTKKEEVKEEVVVSGNQKEVLSPIGGKVLSINVNKGDKVKKGDVLCIIEAMKLENEVKCAQDGVVSEIKVTKGAMVANKEVLFIIG